MNGPKHHKSNFPSPISIQTSPGINPSEEDYHSKDHTINHMWEELIPTHTDTPSQSTPYDPLTNSFAPSPSVFTIFGNDHLTPQMSVFMSEVTYHTLVGKQKPYIKNRPLSTIYK